jgi:protein associated with RNAse G/E
MQTTKATIYYSESEGWIHLLTFFENDGITDIRPATSELMPYSEEQLNYYIARANADPNIVIFECERISSIT